jgi:hypothetical protein
MRGGEGGIPIRTLSRLGLQPQVGPEKAASPTRPGKGLEGIDEAEGNATDRVGSSPPPEDSRFHPGQSGNPGGRPLDVKSLSDIVRRRQGSDLRRGTSGHGRCLQRQGRRRAFAVGWAHPIFGRVMRPDTRLTFIVTLVTASIFRGVILVISQGLQMSGLPREGLAKANAPSAAEEDAPIRGNLVSHLCLSNQEGALT